MGSYYLVISGYGKDRRVLAYCHTNASAQALCDEAVLQGYPKMRVGMSSRRPPLELYCRPIGPKEEPTDV